MIKKSLRSYLLFITNPENSKTLKKKGAHTFICFFVCKKRISFLQWLAFPKIITRPALTANSVSIVDDNFLWKPFHGSNRHKIVTNFRLISESPYVFLPPLYANKPMCKTGAELERWNYPEQRQFRTQVKFC